MFPTTRFATTRRLAGPRTRQDGPWALDLDLHQLAMPPRRIHVPHGVHAVVRTGGNLPPVEVARRALPPRQACPETHVEEHVHAH